MNAFTLKSLLSTSIKLGLLNVARILVHRARVQSGLFEKLTPPGQGYPDPLFSVLQTQGACLSDLAPSDDVIAEANRLCDGYLRLFSNRLCKVNSPPDWCVNPLNGRPYPNSKQHWSRLNDFDSESGDIKSIWELSRFDWALTLARAYRLTDDKTYFSLLNRWSSDWTKHNTLNVGPNWKCGQETAIRMLQVLLAAYLLRQHNEPNSGLKRLVEEHCSRIAATISYGIAQNNNHGTSEAAALYVGGAWLISQNPHNKRIRKKAQHWHRLGKRWLENRVYKLISSDGSFSQYSLNYHRILLDTLNIVEFWRRELDLSPFSDSFYERARPAVLWLYQLIDPQTGDGPNLGSNDGARLFVLSDTDYRDCRPSVQVGAVLFLRKRVYRQGPWDEPLAWLGLNDGDPFSAASHRIEGQGKMGSDLSGVGGHKASELNDQSLGSPPNSPRQIVRLVGDMVFHKEGAGFRLENHPQAEFVSSTLSNSKEDCRESDTTSIRLKRKSTILADGGYVIMNFEKSTLHRSWGLVRFPNFHFRPVEADALHLDLWYKGINILRDSGSFSYHVEEPWQSYFPGTSAHNTIQFDERDQMPRLSRFLFGEWLQMEHCGELIENDGRLFWTGSYVDFRKCRHQRTVSSDGLLWKIVDEVEGFKQKAILRWRLMPGSWVLKGYRCAGDLAELMIDCNTPITRFELVDGWESRHYMEKTKLPVLEVEVEPGKATITTQIRLKT